MDPKIYWYRMTFQKFSVCHYIFQGVVMFFGMSFYFYGRRSIIISIIT